MSVVIETTLGDITVDLFTRERPIACMNFLKLCRLKYYNFNLFHTVQQGFIAQTGDPSGAGDGGCSVWGVVEGMQKRFFEAEYLPKIHHSSAGMLSLVSAGKNLVGSQFFFTLGENLSSLDGSHCVIGEVVEGHEVLRKLNDAIVDDSFRPYQDIRITHTVVLEDPYPNPRGLQAPSRSPSPSAERLQNGRIAADEDIDDTDGMTMEELQEMLAEREAKARATILEIVGDLPDADMAPPENVLFVCKLNPVTTDDDLEIIFSRFGVVKGCEVIRDRKTGDSLQYAFVEFEDQKSCEAAYFKMDNVLIDDRRIHVDFSQSVSKVTWRGKGRGVVGDEGRLDFDNLRDNNDRKKPNNGRGRTEDRRDRNRSDNPRSRMSSAERRTAREQRHQDQKERDDEKIARKGSGSREQRDRRHSRSRDHGLERTRKNSDRKRLNDYDRKRDEKRTSRSTDLTQRRRSRSRDIAERRPSRSREQTYRRRSRSRDQHERRRSQPRDHIERLRSRSRDPTEKKQPQFRDRHDARRIGSPQERRRIENGGGSYRETVRNQKVSPNRRWQSRDRNEHRLDKMSSPERKRKLSVEKSKKPDRKKSKHAASSSSDSSISSSESESDSDSISSDSSEDSSSSSSSSDERSKRKRSKKSKQKNKSKSSHKSKKKKHRK
ncbi:peptidyl-prolyl cis-trans isomerase sig-7 [Drosophila eugracilis]|uniref:peptidyl-prolyl cis-trans isomerase sig-7 n=1 Tax=Drosophila eugracilis TaxID=29029 RepID=UPI001BDAB9FF|nr:peptidyl-prolyl cis-trans isomerase sig-7 [Drosophila eugracilis]